MSFHTYISAYYSKKVRSKKTEMFSLRDPFAWEFFCPHFKSDICKHNRRSHVKLYNILFILFFKKEKMKWNEMRMKPCVWIMIWGWMTWKRSLAFNNDDGKKLYKKKNNQQIYLQKTVQSIYKKNKKIKTSLPPSLPPSVSLYPCTLPWNRNQKTIKGKFSTDQDRILTFRTVDNNLHWPLSIRPHQPPRLPFSLPPGPSVPLPPSVSHPPPPSLISFTLHFCKFKILY